MVIGLQNCGQFGEREGGLERRDKIDQGTNARKVISEVYAFFVLQCTVFGL